MKEVQGGGHRQRERHTGGERETQAEKEREMYSDEIKYEDQEERRMPAEVRSHVVQSKVP